MDDALVLANPAETHTVLFATGRGGDPERHRGLLEHLATRGASVIAPRFEMVRVPTPSWDDLKPRVDRIRAALDAAPAGIPIVGVGHSLGAALLLAFAGADLWLFGGRRLPVTRDARLRRLVLLAPATDFLQAPGALDSVRVPIQAWFGTADPVAPPERGERMRDALDGVRLDLRVVDDADHFTFMDTRPPGRGDETHPDRDGFLASLADAVADFAHPYIE